MLSRRQAAAALAALVLIAPLAALAQRQPPVPRIGYLEAAMPQNGSSRFLEDFAKGFASWDMSRARTWSWRSVSPKEARSAARRWPMNSFA
jgi:hypothetical protein